VVPAREGLRQTSCHFVIYLLVNIGEVVPAREGLRPPYNIVYSKAGAIGEVVPAREGLRLIYIAIILVSVTIGEVVPAREGLRRFLASLVFNEFNYRRSGSSKRRIKTISCLYNPPFHCCIGEVVPAREGLRQIKIYPNERIQFISEKWFQQEKD